jgi:hypothetical protein
VKDSHHCCLGSGVLGWEPSPALSLHFSLKLCMILLQLIRSLFLEGMYFSTANPCGRISKALDILRTIVHAKSGSQTEDRESTDLVRIIYFRFYDLWPSGALILFRS